MECSFNNHFVFIDWIPQEVLVLRKLGHGFAQIATDLYNFGASLPIIIEALLSVSFVFIRAPFWPKFKPHIPFFVPSCLSGGTFTLKLVWQRIRSFRKLLRLFERLTANQIKEDNCCRGVTLARCHTILDCFHRRAAKDAEMCFLILCRWSSQNTGGQDGRQRIKEHFFFK